MRRFHRLRKTARVLSKQMGHELGYFYKISDTKYKAHCIYCNILCIIADRNDIKINEDKQFSDPTDLSPMIAAKINLLVKKQLQLNLYGPKQTGYIYGNSITSLCDKNPFITETPSIPLP